jgi:predicted Zn finger-like uncharacterized protein
MSLITRCPACGTMYKVVPDQLRISEGWVRCGYCSEVFDATLHLQGDEISTTEPGELAALREDVAATQALAQADAPTLEDFPSSLNTGADEAPVSEPPDSALLRAEAAALREGPLDRPFVLQRQEIPADAGRTEIAQPTVEPEPELHDLEFVRKARRREFWGSTPMRVMLGLAFGALAVLLALQMAVHDRDRLAATDPTLRPWLARLCEPLNCVIGAPRQIDALAIDSSSFNKLRGDTFRLNVTLKNQAGVEVAMPALELTLTDAQDHAVIRRVLLPGDIQRQPGIIAAGSEWSGSVALAVAPGGGTPRIAGYRLLAFYP